MVEFLLSDACIWLSDWKMTWKMLRFEWTRIFDPLFTKGYDALWWDAASLIDREGIEEHVPSIMRISNIYGHVAIWTPALHTIGFYRVIKIRGVQKISGLGQLLPYSDSYMPVSNNINPFRSVVGGSSTFNPLRVRQLAAPEGQSSCLNS